MKMYLGRPTICNSQYELSRFKGLWTADGGFISDFVLFTVDFTENHIGIRLNPGELIEVKLEAV